MGHAFRVILDSHENSQWSPNGEDPDTPEYRRAFEEAWKSMPSKRLKGGLGANEHGFDETWVYYGGGADYFTRRTVQGRGPVS